MILSHELCKEVKELTHTGVHFDQYRFGRVQHRGAWPALPILPYNRKENKEESRSRGHRSGTYYRHLCLAMIGADISVVRSSRNDLLGVNGPILGRVFSGVAIATLMLIKAAFKSAFVSAVTAGAASWLSFWGTGHPTLPGLDLIELDNLTI
jgi:hypothetical protein